MRNKYENKLCIHTYVHTYIQLSCWIVPQLVSYIFECHPVKFVAEWRRVAVDGTLFMDYISLTWNTALI